MIDFRNIFSRIRQESGLKRARRAGKKFGRKQVVLPDCFTDVCHEWFERKISVYQAAAKCELSVSTFWKHAKELQKRVNPTPPSECRNVTAKVQSSVQGAAIQFEDGNDTLTLTATADVNVNMGDGADSLTIADRSGDSSAPAVHVGQYGGSYGSLHGQSENATGIAKSDSGDTEASTFEAGNVITFGNGVDTVEGFLVAKDGHYFGEPTGANAGKLSNLVNTADALSVSNLAVGNYVGYGTYKAGESGSSSTFTLAAEYDATSAKDALVFYVSEADTSMLDVNNAVVLIGVDGELSAEDNIELGSGD